MRDTNIAEGLHDHNTGTYMYTYKYYPSSFITDLNILTLNMYMYVRYMYMYVRYIYL